MLFIRTQRPVRAVLIAITLTPLIASHAPAAVLTWDGSIADWDEDSRWSLGTEPTVADDAIINAGIANVTQNGEVANSIFIGDTNSGVLNVNSGGVLDTIQGVIANQQFSTGSVIVNGADSLWNNTGTLEVGGFGDGTLNIEAGGKVINTDGYVGTETNSVGTVTVQHGGSEWDLSGVLRVGDAGTGTLTIRLGGQVSSGSNSITSGIIGFEAGSDGTVTVKDPGSKWTDMNLLNIGDFGTGTLNIENGGVVDNIIGRIGLRAGSSGTVNVTGTGSTWNNTAGLYIGGDQTTPGDIGTLSVDDDAVVNVTGNLKIWGQGTLNLNGGSLTTDSLDNSANGALNHTGGTLTINGGTFNAGTLGYTIDGAGSPTTVLTAGTVTTLGGDLTVGDLNQGTLNLSAGSTTTVSNATSVGAQGTLNLDGGEFTTGSINVTPGGSFSFTSGTFGLTSENLTVGPAGQFGSTLDITVGKTYLITNSTIVDATGTINLNGGTLATGTLENSAGGTIDFSSGSFTLTNDDLAIGTTGPFGSTVDVAAGKSYDILNTTNIDASGTLNISGGTFTTGSLDNSANGALNHSGGTLTITGGTFNAGTNDYTIDGVGNPTVALGAGTNTTFGNNLTVGDLNQGTLSLSTESTTTVTGTTTLGAQGLLGLSDGEFTTSSLDNSANGHFFHTGGVLTIDGGTLIPNAGGPTDDYFINRPNNPTVVLTSGATTSIGRDLLLAISDLGTLTIESGSVAAVPGTTRIGSLGTLNLDGGSLTTGSLDNSANGAFNHTGGTLTINGGTFDVGAVDYTLDGVGNPTTVLTAGTVTTLGGDLNIGDLNQGTLSLPAGSTTTVTGTTTLGAQGTLNLDGGSLTTGSLDNAANGAFNHTGGTLTINGGTFNAGAVDYTLDGVGNPTTVLTAGTVTTLGGDLTVGDLNQGTLTLPAGSTTTVTGTTALGTQGTLNLDGGALNTGSLDNSANGNLNHTGGTLTINGGVFNAGTLDYTIDGAGNPTVVLDTGTSTTFGNNLTVGGPNQGTLTLSSGSTTAVTGTTHVGALGVLSLDGGNLSTNSLINNLGGGFNHTGGTLTINGGTFDNGAIDYTIDGIGNPTTVLASGTNTTIGNNLTVGDLNQGTLSLATGSTTTVNGTTNVGTLGTLTLNGGELVTGALDVAPGGNFNFSSGTLGLTSGDLVIGPTGQLGSTLFVGGENTYNITNSTVVDAGGMLNLVNGALINTGSTVIDASGTLNLTGGVLNTGSLDNSANGNFVHTNGVLIIDGGTLIPNAGGPTDDYIIDRPNNPTVVLTSGATTSVGRDLIVGDTNPGTLTIESGSVAAVPGTTQIGGLGTLNLDGGSLTTGSLDNSANGAFNHTGGTLTINGGTFNTGAVDYTLDGTGNPTTILTSGTVTSLGGDLTIGDLNQGTLSLPAGSSTTVNGTTALGTLGTLNLDGGSLSTGSLDNSANGTFNHSGGTLTINGGVFNAGTLDYTIDGTGNPTVVLDAGTNTTFGNNLIVGDLNQGTLALPVGSTTTVTGATNVGAQGVLSLDGGAFTTGTMNVSPSGSFIFTSGTFGLTSGDLTVGPAGQFGSTLDVTAGKTYHITNSTVIDALGTLNLDGGSLTTGSLDNSANGVFTHSGGTLTITGGVFNAGTLDYTIDGAGNPTVVLDAGTNTTFGNNLTVGNLNQGTLTLPTGSTTAVTGATNVGVQGVLSLDGGAFTTGSLDVTPGGSFSFTSGTFGLTSGNLNVGPTGQFGSILDVTAGKTYNITNSTIIDALGTLNLDGGSLTTGSLDNSANGNFNHTGGTLTITGGVFNAGTLDYTIDGTGNPTVVLDTGTNTTFGNNLTIGDLNQGTLSLATGTTTTVIGATTLGAQGTLILDGGDLSTDSLINNLGGGFTHTGGTLTINGGTFDNGAIDYIIDGIGNPTTVLASGANTTIGNDLTIGGLNQGTLTLATGSTTAVTGATHVGAQGVLSLDGGIFNTGSLDITPGGSFSFTSGTFGLASGDLNVGPAGQFGSTLDVTTGKTYNITNSTIVDAAGTLNLNGGSLTTGSTVIDALGTLNLYGGALTTGSLDNSANGNLNHTGGTLTITGGVFNAGTLDYTIDGAGNPTLVLDTGTNTAFGDNLTIGDLNQGTLTLSAGSTTTVSNATSVGSQGALSLNGGEFNTGSLDITPGGSFSFTSGTFGLTSGDLSVGPTGQFGSTLDVAAGKTLNITNSTVIDPLGTLNLNGGDLTTGSLDNSANGTFSHTGGTLIIAGGTFNAGTIDYTIDGSGNPTVLLNPGTNTTFGNNLTIGELSQGTLSLASASTTTVTGTTTLGAQGTLNLDGGNLTTGSLINTLGGNLNHTRGTLTINGGTFLPSILGPTGNYTIDGANTPRVILGTGATTTIGGDLNIGTLNRGYLQLLTGSDTTVNGATTLGGAQSQLVIAGDLTTDSLSINSGGRLDFFLGDLTSGPLTLGSQGTLNLSGTGSVLRVTDFDNTAGGNFNHVAGTLIVEGGGTFAPNAGGSSDDYAIGGPASVNTVILGSGTSTTIGRNLLIGGSNPGSLFLNTGSVTNVNSAISLSSAGILNLNGGTLNTRSFFNTLGGTFNHAGGTLHIEGQGSTFNPGTTDYTIDGAGNPIVSLGFRNNTTFANNLNIGNLNQGTLSINTSDQATIVNGVTTLGAQGTLNINSGTFVTGSLINDQGGNFNHNGGALSINGGTFNPGTTNYNIGGAANPRIFLNNGNFAISNHLNIGTLNSGSLFLLNGSNATVNGTTTIGAQGVLNLNNSSFTTDDLVVNPGGNLDFVSGTLNLNSGNLTIGNTGQLGPILDVTAGKLININNSTIIDSTGTLNLNFGSLTTGSFDNSSGGTFNHIAGSLTVNGGSFTPNAGAPYTIDGISNPTVTLQNSSANLSNDLIIGDLNRGTLVLDSFSTFNVNNGTTTIGPQGALEISGATSSLSTLGFNNTAGGDFIHTGGGLALLGGDFQPNAGGPTDDYTIEGVGNPSVLLFNSNATFGRNLFVGNSNPGTLTLVNASTATVPIVTSISDQGTINLDGGDLITFSLFNTTGGTFNHTDGSLTIAGGVFQPNAGGPADDYIIDTTDFSSNPTVNLESGASTIIGNHLVVGDLEQGTLNITSGSTFTVNGGTTLGAKGVLHLNAATLTTGSLDITPGGIFNFTTGTFNLTSDDLSISPTGQFGSTLEVAAGQTYSITNSTNIDATGTLILNGGTFNTGSLDNSAGGGLNFVSGTFGLTSDDLTVGSTGPFGSTLATTADQTYQITNSTIIDATGTLNLNGGTFRTGSLDNSAGGTLNFQNGTLEITNGLFQPSVIGGAYSVNGVTGSDFPHLIFSNGLTNTFAGALIVANSNHGELTIKDSSEVSSPFGVIGTLSTSTGVVTVEDSGSRWNNAGNLTVGNSGNGTLDIKDGGFVSNSFSHIARFGGSIGNVTVSDSGSTWFNTNGMSIGEGGTGALDILNDGLVISNGTSRIATTPGSMGTVTVSDPGSTWDNNSELVIGSRGNGTLIIQDGGSVSNFAGTVADLGGSTGTVTVTGLGSVWSSTGPLSIGQLGNGSLDVEDGGLVVSSSVASIGNLPGSTGSVTVANSGSAWSNIGTLSIGSSGNGTLAIEDEGSVSSSTVNIGQDNGSTGHVSIVDDFSRLIISQNLYIGGSSTGSGGAGTLSIPSIGANSSGGSVFVGDGLSGTDFNSRGLVVISDSDPSGTTGGRLVIYEDGTLDHSGNASLGRHSGEYGFADVVGADATWNLTSRLFVGFQGHGELNVQDGGSVLSQIVTIGRGHTGEASITGKGSSLTTNGRGILEVGLSANEYGIVGDGTLNILDGGLVSSDTTILGNDFSATGTTTVSGSESGLISKILNIGYRGDGTLLIDNGGTVKGQQVYIGRYDGSDGLVTVSGAGSNLSSTNNLMVGSLGNGDLIIENGGSVTSDDSIIANLGTSAGTVTVTGPESNWYNAGDLLISDALGSNGSLIIDNNGIATVAGTTTLGTQGTLQIDGGGFHTGSFNNSAGGTINFISGTFGLTSDDLTVDVTGQFGSTLGVTAGQIYEITNSSNLAAAGTLNINGGKFYTGSLNTTAGGTFNFNTGTFGLTSDDLTVGPAGLFGSTLDVTAGKTYDITNTTIVDASGTININGGTFNTSSLDNSAGGAFNFTSGTFGLTSDNLTVGPTGLFGPTLDVTAGKAYNITNTTLVDAASTLNISGGAFSTGSLDNTSGGNLNHTGGSLTVTGGSFAPNTGGPTDDYTIEGTGSPIVVLASGATTTIGRDLAVGGADPGTLSIISDSVATVTGTTTIGVQGTLVLNGGTLNTASFDHTAGGTFLFNAGTFRLTSGDLNVGPSSSTVSPVPVLNVTSGRTYEAVNATVVQPGGNLILNGGTLNTSSLVINPGATYSFNSGTLGLTSDDMIIGSSGPLGSALALSAGKHLNIDNATAIQSTGALVIDGGTLNTGSLNNTAGGTLSFLSGTIGLTNDDLIIGAGGPLGTAHSLASSQTLNIDNATIIQSGGTLVINGGTLTTGTLDHTAGGSFNFSDGSLTVDSFLGTLDQDGGTLSPGASPGITTISGDYNFNAGTIAIEIGGTSPGSGHDQIQVAGTLNLGPDSVLDISFIDGFSPAPFDTFDIFDFGVQAGEFGAIRLPNLSGSLQWRTGGLLPDGDGSLFVVASSGISLIQGDLDGDGFVGISDLNLLLINWNNTVSVLDPLATQADPSGDGFVGIDDLNTVLGNWNAGTPPPAISASIPEPASAAILLPGIVILGNRYRQVG